MSTKLSGEMLREAILAPARLDELFRSRLLDTPPEEPFDRLTRLAARLLDSPVALVSLVDDRRQFFKSAYGLPQPWASSRETPLSHSFCQHVVASAVPLIVEDAREHALVRDNLAVKDLNAIAYLGIPLTTPNGATLGSFCVVDSKPRKWTPADQQTMADLAESVISEISLRFAHGELQTANRRLRGEAAKREHLLHALQSGAARLRAAQRLAHVGSFVLSMGVAPNGHWSDEARRIFGSFDDQLTSTVAGFVEHLVHPDDQRRVGEAIERALLLKQCSQIEYRSCKSSGDIRTLVTIIEPDRQDNDPRTALLTVMDITERVLAEAQVAELRNELWHVARVATAGEMATVIAHEINQPLAAISHTANACQRLNDTGDIDRDGLSKHLASISTQARRASQIVGQIRSYARKQPSKPQALSMNKIVDDILNMLLPWSGKYGIIISRVQQDGLPSVVGDEIQLGQLVLNLLRNAFDAVAGNVATDRKVTVRTSCIQRRSVVLEISDNGPGVPEDLREKIFEPFFSSRTSGLGMGLPIAKTIAEAHRAALSLVDRPDSEPGVATEGPRHRGACFRVAFVAADQEPSAGLR